MLTRKKMEKELGCNNKKLVGKVCEDEIQEDILILTVAKDKLGFWGSFLVKWREKGRVLVVKWLLLTFIAGLFEHWCEPIYRVLTPSIFLQEENKIDISVNTRIYVWNITVDANINKEIIMIEYCGTKEDRTNGYWMKYDKCIECGYVENSKTNLKPSVSGNSVNKMKKYKNHYTYRYQMRLQK